MAHTLEILANPYVAFVVGLACAVGLLNWSRASYRRIRPGSSSANDLIKTSMALFGRLGAATIAMWAYKTFAYSGFKPFAFALAGGFLFLYTIEVVRFAGLDKYRRPGRVEKASRRESVA